MGPEGARDGLGKAYSVSVTETCRIFFGNSSSLMERKNIPKIWFKRRIGYFMKSQGPSANPGVQRKILGSKKFWGPTKFWGPKKKSWGPKFWGPGAVHKLNHYD
ncbi:MAG: hypothetical protein GY800_00765 [Planctomycetes bacterium]|nr:hypothetical protein [Planctomycetota bacterium]